MKLKDITNIIEKWSPLQQAETFDNVGLLVGDPNSNVEKALITIDTTETVIEEAIKNKCDLIITFHPRSLPQGYPVLTIYRFHTCHLDIQIDHYF